MKPNGKTCAVAGGANGIGLENVAIIDVDMNALFQGITARHQGQGRLAGRHNGIWHVANGVLSPDGATPHSS